MPESHPTRSNTDAAIDAALDAATAKAPASPAAELPLKKLWDDDLEAELEAALAGFDAENYEVKTPRTRAADRAHVEKSSRGQEASPGLKQGKVIGVRGKSVFVDLGAKSEGVVPVEQFGESAPQARRHDRGQRRPLRHRRGHPPALPEGGGRRGQLGEPAQGPDRRGQGHQDEQGGPRRRGRRHPRLPADRPDRHQPRRGRLGLRRPEAPRHRHRGQPAREEPRRLQPRAHGADAGRDAREDLGGARGGAGPLGRRPLGQGLRRLRRPRRRRRPAPHRRHELGPHCPTPPASSRSASRSRSRSSRSTARRRGSASA